MEYEIIGSIVTYKNKYDLLKKLADSFLSTNLKVKLYIIDNSPTDEIRQYFKDVRVEYIFNNLNLGYGAGHNIAIRKSLDVSKYFLVLNPDIYFEKGTLEGLYDYMEKNKEIGIITPKILYPDGTLQYLCKLLPTPFDLIFRKFMPFKSYIEKRNYFFELRFFGYDKIIEVPYISGCFMFFKTEVFKDSGYFDENIFMYGEDTDISRRIHKNYKTIFYPYVHIYHEHQKESYKSLRILLVHMKSLIYYFNKWGWFFDKERDIINAQVIKKLNFGNK